MNQSLGSKGLLLAGTLAAATIALVIIGTLWPTASAAAYAGAQSFLRSPSSAEAAVDNLGDDLRAGNLAKAYAGLANKSQFSQADFTRDIDGSFPGLLSYATLDSFQVRPLHSSDTNADVQLSMKWSTVVGPAVTTRDIHVIKSGDRWVPEWPLVKEASVPPQVIPVNYLRWDVIYRGPGDDWGAQDAEAPHIRIVDMHPVERAEGVVVMGELLNEDVVPAYVGVTATLLTKAHTPISTEGSFDKISHLLLPKQVTPFMIKFPNVSLSDVGAVDMHPTSSLVAASADPVIEISDEQLHPAPGATLTGSLINESGQVVNVAHVLGTFYDKAGQVVWVADAYTDRALLPQTPQPFVVHIPEDLAKNVASQRTVIASYSSGGAL